MAKSAVEATIEKTVKALTKRFGSLESFDKAFLANIKGYVPTGNLAVDWVIGRPGFPLGRVSEISGRYGSGKSSVVAMTIAAAQKAGMVVIIFDTEHSYTPDWLERFGAKPSEIIPMPYPHLEGMFDNARHTISKIAEINGDEKTPILIIIDSVSALPTAAEMNMEDSSAPGQRAAHASAISRGLRQLSNLIWDRNVALVFLSQMKDDPSQYGSGKSKIGGAAINFHAGLLLEVTKTAFLKDGAKVNGQTIQVKAVKNKFVPPFRIQTFDLFFENEPFHPKEILLDFLADEELVGSIKKSGGWFEYEGSKYRKEDLAPKMDLSLTEQTYETLGLTPEGTDKRVKV